SRHAEHRHLTHHRPDFAVGHHAEPPPKIAGQAPISHKLRGIAFGPRAERTELYQDNAANSDPIRRPASG
ncbi:MAG: hypothetical protein WBB62_13020, partial [Rhodococcus sp. (in: high G+C Gram-positive bacteria)]